MARAMSALKLLLHLLTSALAFEAELLPAGPKITAHLGDRLVLTCRSSGCASPRFTWRAEMDVPLAAAVQTGSTESTLTMERLGVEHEHLYLCTSTCGSVSKQMKVQIEVYSFPHDPIIETSTTLEAGAHCTVTCTVPDVFPSDLLSVQLIKDGQILAELPYDSDRSLKTKNLSFQFIPKAEDNGKEFICTAKLSFDDPKKEPQQRESTKKVNVNYPPQNTAISITPFSTVLEGANLTLTCTARGNPPARIIWRKQSSHKSLQTLGETGSIAIPNAEFTDSGVYICEAKNTAGSTTVQTEISVQGQPKIPQISIFPSTSVKEGDSIRIQCLAEGNPAAKITLRKKSEDGDRVLQSANGTVPIADVQFQDAGLYECEAENTFGRKRISALLIVEFGPVIVISVEPSTVKEGDVVTLLCTSYGNPSPEISWKKYLAPGSSQFISKDAALILKDVKMDDSGIYECEGINQHGKDRKAVELIVQVPPQETTLAVLPSETVKEGDNVFISCTSVGVPAPQIILKQKTEAGDRVLESEDGTYTIQEVQEEHAGTYECEATNKLGQQSRSIKLDVQVPPRNTTVFVSPSEKVTEGDNVTITCTTYCNPSPMIILKKVFPENETILFSKNGTFTLYDVTKSDTGKYIIDVSNNVGNDTKVIEISVIEKMDNPKPNSLGITLLLCASCLAVTAAAGVALYKFKQAKLKGSYSLINALRRRL
ncbi:vascular cell adhesion protein 1 [Rhinatrema bivittatum]|uniref:vascular cell adhesion protein 1 n=1 Tax=Rhinatrema bivittatum TaxID=194408 RepID=UPI001126A0D9|nr:vascular cell adhesion protein 1 [Rhinatrema bivittatum]